MIRFAVILPSTIKLFIQDGRATLRGWAEYKHQTGKLPWVSITVHFSNLVIVLSGIVFLVWCGGKYQWSRWQFVGILVLVGLPYGFLWSSIKGKVKLNQIRNGRRLARMKTMH